MDRFADGDLSADRDRCSDRNCVDNNGSGFDLTENMVDRPSIHPFAVAVHTAPVVGVVVEFDTLSDRTFDHDTVVNRAVNWVN